MNGYGYPVHPVGLIYSSFRPSDGATLYSFLVPSNFFAVVSLRQDDQEICHCIQTLKTTHAGTGFMHESFNKDNPAQFARAWFAWANTIFREFLWKTCQEKPQLLA